MRVLVTGGAGYVGSVSVERLVEAGHDVVVLDDLSTGHREAVPRRRRRSRSAATATPTRSARLLERARVDAILHCAARSLVGESVRDPARYYRDNVAGGIVLLEARAGAGVERIVFSSTAAVYGVPDATPIPEDAPLRADQPVRRDEAHVRGRAPLLRRGVRPPERVAPLLQRRRRDGAERRAPRPRDAPDPERPPGRRDGRADHALRRRLPDAGRHLHPRLHPRRRPRRRPPRGARGDGARRPPDATRPLVCNLGIGGGFSVREVVAAAEARRRPADPDDRWARAAPAIRRSSWRRPTGPRAVLGWTAARPTLEEMIGSAWAWRRREPWRSG